MKFIKSKTRGMLLTLLCMVLLSCSILCYAFLQARVADAFPSVSSTSVTSPLYDFEKNCYNESALDEMAKLILISQGGSGSTINDLISYVTRVPASGEAIKDKTLTLKYGRYRFTQTSASYNDLIWMPVYLSKASNGHSILTLYLAFTTTNKSTSQQEQGWFSAQGLYSDSYSIGSPSNNYGASHMRSISLGAVTPYAKYPNGSYKLDDAPEVKESNSNKFSNFIQGTDFKGVLYDDLVSPSQISWQANEKFSAVSSGFLANASNTSIDFSPYASNLWPNEAYDLPAGESGYYLNNFFNYATKTQYNDWKNDKVWLPSLTEVGNGDNASGFTTSGLWQLTNEQRSNAQKTWLRTAYTAADKSSASDGSKYSTYTMFCTDTSGKVTSGDVSEQNAIRPAIHLDLSIISGKTTAGISLPDIITVPYKREPYTGIADFVGESWYADFLIVSFYLDETTTFGVNPVDAGEYYMLVQINSSSDKPESNTEFVGGGKSRVIRFVIEKRKLKVQWNYADDGVPINPYFDESDILEGDEAPKLGVYYKNITGGGDPYYNVYPDIKGHYRAYAYILDEEKYNYNYEIDGESYSAQFYVGERVLPLPEFIYGPSDTISADRMRLDISYKGKSYVQIKNISKTMTVTVSSRSDPELNNIKDLGWYEDPDVIGIQTYMVENVGEYVFTVSLSKIDKENAIWDSSSGAADITDKVLTLNVKQAIITASFLDLPSSWGVNTAMSFRIGLVGVQTGDKPELNVYYQPARGGNMTTLKADANGVYTIPAGLNAGDYTVNAVLGNDIQLNGPYMMEKGASQKFTITQSQTSFNESYVTWKYTVGGKTNYLNEIGSHNTQSSAVELDFVNDYYQFTLQLSEDMLKNNYQVRATYSGATYQRDAGSYSITVTISAYDSNVAFESQSYTVYFKINKTAFDVSQVKWDYTAPFKYTGNYCRVFLTNLPDGLAVNYTGNESKDLGSHTATARFVVLDDYAKNYLAPEDMTLEWEISESGSVVYPGEYNFTNLRLLVEHIGSTTLYLTWNESRGRWMNDGQEFVFSFPYDGETYTIRLEGEVDGLSFGTPSNNSFRNAGSFTATFNIIATDGREVPLFNSVKWTIEKAELNFENVRWGFIDADGNEYDRDFDNSPFTFTRNENGPVKLMVGLIGLPVGVKLNYTVTCLTVKDSVTLTGSTFDVLAVSQAGVYQTSFNRNITFNDPNYVTISRIPDFIPSFQNWTIMEREFPEAKNDGSWVKFDNRIHNLMDIIGMTEADLLYFRVEIAFYNGVGKVINYYDGTNFGFNDKYDAMSAGTYLVTFFELRGDDEIEYFWECIEITVAKETVRITWDDQGSIPVARVEGVYVSDIIGTKYYTAADDVERSADYVTSATSNGVKFYAVPYVMDKYAGDLAIENADRYDFEYEYFQPSANSVRIDKSQITIIEPSFEFTGGKVTFNLSGYYFGYSSYLYYTGDSLEQTDIGVYHIDINFRKTADAYWDGTTGDRSTLRLTFEITSPSSIALDKPTLVTSTVTYDGKPHTLEITNWTILRNFISYEVIRSDGRNYAQATSLTDVGTYTIRFYFPAGSIGYWKSGGTEDCFLTFTIKARTTTGSGGQGSGDNTGDQPGQPGQPEKDPYEVALPDLIQTREFDGRTVNPFNNWDDIKDYVQFQRLDTGEWTDDIGYVAWESVGVYRIHVRLKNANLYYWSDGTVDEKVFTFTIYAATVDTGGLHVGSDGKVTGPNASGSDIDFNDFLDYTYYDEDGKEVDESDLENGKDYTVRVDLKPDIFTDEDVRRKFYETFTNADELIELFQNHGPWSFTYSDGTGYNRLLLIITIAEVIMLIFEIIATIIVLLVQRKLYNTEEDEYDSYDDYEEYDDYDDYDSYDNY